MTNSSAEKSSPGQPRADAAETVRRLACDCVIVRHVVKGASEPDHVGPVGVEGVHRRVLLLRDPVSFLLRDPVVVRPAGPRASFLLRDAAEWSGHSGYLCPWCRW